MELYGNFSFILSRCSKLCTYVSTNHTMNFSFLSYSFTQSHVNKEFDDVFDKNSKLIPANINTKVTLNYSSKSHFEEVGTLSRQFIVNSHGGIKAAAFLTEMIRMVFLTTFLQHKIFLSLAIPRTGPGRVYKVP